MNTAEYCLMKFSPPPMIGRVCSQTIEQGNPLRAQTDINQFELHFVHTGTVQVRQKGLECSFSEGSAFLIFPKQESLLSARTPICREFLLRFTLGMAAVPLSEQEAARWEPSRYTNALLSTRLINPKACRLVGELIRRYLALRQSSDPVRYIRCRACFSEIIAELSADALTQARQNTAKSSGKSGAYCDAAKTYIASHLREKISVEAVARQIGISYNYLNRQFVRQEGLSLVTYINREKIRLAGRLLEEEELSQEEAAAAVGIGDVKYFRRLFRRFTGMTVTEYRKLYRNTML